MIVTDEQILDVLENFPGKRADQAEKVGLTKRQFLKRIKKLREAGKINLDGSIPNFHPGPGREITSVSTKLDEEGNPLFFSVREKIATGEHTPVIDAPIVRQSRFIGRSGEVLGQWDIRVPRSTQEAEKALIEGFTAELVRAPPVALRDEDRSDQLLNEYVFSDSHLGGMSNVETEEQLEDQCNLISSCFERMIATSPKTQTAIINILGDWFHFDNLLPLTPRSGNVLFANGNYRKMIEAGIKLMRRLIEKALMCHERVIVVIAEGNHDQASALWLRMMMAALYENDPRLEVIDSQTSFFALPFGKTFLGYHHGHIKGLKDTKDLALYFAAEFRKMWGETEHTFLKTGHLHHIHEKEEHGVLIKQQPTLASKDHHAHQHGYRSNQAAVCTTYSREYGEVATNRITKEMLISAK